MVELKYFDLYLNSRHVFGGCPNWLSFINNDLGLSEYNYEPQLINFTVVGPPSASSPAAFSVQSRICDEGVALNNILELITTYSSGSVTCGNRRWVVKVCGGSSTLSLCIDCADPCRVNNTQSLYISPCEAQFTYGIQIFSVSYRTLLLPPRIQTLVAVPSNSSIKVVATLSASGILHCGAFSPATATSSISSYAVLQQNYNSATDKLNVTTVNIAGLAPSSSYSLYCYTFYAGLTSSTEDMIANMRVVNTTCCKSIVITSGVDSAKFFSVQVDGLPSHSIDVILSLNATAAVIYPLKVTLNSYDSSVHSASLRSLPAGVYTYAALVAGPSAHEYALSYTAGFQFRVITPGQSLPPPSIRSISSILQRRVVSHHIVRFSYKQGKYSDYIQLQYSISIPMRKIISLPVDGRRHCFCVLGWQLLCIAQRRLQPQEQYQHYGTLSNHE